MGAGCVETTVGETELDIVQVYLLHPQQLATVCLLIKAYVKVSSKRQRGCLGEDREVWCESQARCRWCEVWETKVLLLPDLKGKVQSSMVIWLVLHATGRSGAA